MVKKRVDYLVTYKLYKDVFLKKADLPDNTISNLKLRRLLGSIFHIPSWSQLAVINVMVDARLIERVDTREEFKILCPNKEVFD